MHTTRRLFIVDENLLAAAIQALLNTEKRISACSFPNIQQACQALGRELPDLLIADLFSSGGGLTRLKDLLNRFSGLKVLVLSSFAEVPFGIRALRAGALGYLMKSAPTGELFKAVRLITDNSGGRYMSPLLKQSVDSVRRVGQAVKDPANALSDREFDVYVGTGAGATPKQLADYFCVTKKTIEAQKKSIKEKLGFSSGGELNNAAAVFYEVTGGRRQ